MEKSDIKWITLRNSLLLHAQFERYDLIRSSQSLRAAKELSDCYCNLPNKQYCMLNVQPVFSSNERNRTPKKYQWVPMSICSVYSSSTPTVPYSTTDILYGNEVRNSPQLDEIRQNSFIEYSKDKDRHSSNNLVDFNNRRPASKGGSRKSLSIEKVNFNKESDDNLRPILPSPGKNGNQYRPNGLRNGLLKGDPLYGSRGGNYSSGRESDDLIAMGTIWSPNTGPQKNSGSNSANGIQNVTGKSVSMVASNSTTTVARKNVKPIMVQNSSSHGRSSFKEVEPRYTDPVIGAQPSFQQRLMELSALESETIRYEKSKKVKKKVRDRDS